MCNTFYGISIPLQWAEIFFRFSFPKKLAIRYFNKIYGLGISFDCINGQSGSFVYTVWVGNRRGFDE